MPRALRSSTVQRATLAEARPGLTPEHPATARTLDQFDAASRRLAPLVRYHQNEQHAAETAFWKLARRMYACENTKNLCNHNANRIDCLAYCEDLLIVTIQPLDDPDSAIPGR